MKKFIIAVLTLGALFAFGCTNQGAASRAQQTSQAITGTYQERLTSAVPYPLDLMTYSTERANLRERLLRENDPAKIGYVYLMNNIGNVITYYTIKGKVSSTDSQLTTSQINISCAHKSACTNNAAGDDGSYGPNEKGVFFFTTESVLVEWNGQWLYSDYPLTVKESPTLGYDASKAKPSSVAPGQ